MTPDARARASRQIAGELHMQLHVCLDKASAIAPRLVDLVAAHLSPQPPTEGP